MVSIYGCSWPPKTFISDLLNRQMRVVHNIIIITVMTFTFTLHLADALIQSDLQ